MQAEIITIGDEILIGQIIDSNSKWIAEELNKIGISVYQISSIQDKETHILRALKEAQKHSDIVILTGGLGPTKDDITKLTLAKYFKDTLVLNESVVSHIKILFKKMNYPFTALNRDQALVPSKSIVLKNDFGTAPGMLFIENNKVVVSIPGVPYEMKGLMEMEIIPRFQKMFELPFIVHKTVLTYGMGESMLAEKIESWENHLPEFISLAYLPSFGKVRLRLTAKGNDEKLLLEEAIDKEVDTLTKLIGDIIIGYDDKETLEVIIGRLLQQKNQTLSVAESCTGGKISETITAIPGSSNYFKGGIIAYHKMIKIKELNVNPAIIDANSVVSKEVALEMVKGIQKKYNTNYAIATTGNAGPTVDVESKTAGKVFIAIAGPLGVFVEEYFFGKPRKKVIERATTKALELLRKEILKN